jgi:hypothetical protein
MNRCRHGHGSRLSVAAVSVSALVSATERVAAAPTHLETAIYVLEKAAIRADAQRRSHWLNAHRSDRCGIGEAPNVNRNPTILTTQNVEETPELLFTAKAIGKTSY